jgi:type I restriction enzyme R subunit
VQGVKQCREDTVLLVNGIPLVIAEYKSYLASGKDWPRRCISSTATSAGPADAGAERVSAWRPTRRNSATARCCFTMRARKTSTHLDTWGPLAEPLPGEERAGGTIPRRTPDDPLEVPVKGLLRLKPCHVLDFLQHFVVFETKKGKTVKKVARYQQFEAVNDIVDRTCR